jgi:hypothetical protein
MFESLKKDVIGEGLRMMGMGFERGDLTSARGEETAIFAERNGVVGSRGVLLAG